MTSRKKIGQVEIVFRFYRHTGGRYIHGELTLQFDGLQPYKFSSSATWSDKDNYENVVQRTIEKALMEIQGHIDSPSVLLKEIVWDEVSSCSVGFESAARAATFAAFEV
jgi:hypothetical protein